MENFKIKNKINYNFGLKFLAISASLFLCMALSSCSIFRPYKIPIQQGRQFSQKTIEKLKPNMTKDQVRYLLGEPNANSPLENNQWLYVYTNQHNYLPRSESKLILTFTKEGKLTNISGNLSPPAELSYKTVGIK
jgi:outer membrane protein assembly factor BamE